MEDGGDSGQAGGIRMRMPHLSKARTRGLGPSVGAGSSLVGAGLVCLIAVSAMLAYRDWPGTEAGRPDGRLIVRVPDGKVDGRAASGPVAAAELVVAAGEEPTSLARARPPRRRPSAAERPSAAARP